MEVFLKIFKLKSSEILNITIMMITIGFKYKLNGYLRLVSLQFSIAIYCDIANSIHNI